ncbi:hypothetical protein [Bradyrhizobium sp. 62]|uniref:hypothetical protein n=1 Tax=Bradyrhizobium sp. 62 TaxID=1043588 RepID=UPI001FF886F1|nr:hypothetical protein [Bradyrhizobium sp. 62]MCK1365175.1 hypothetical protein [Bradyrhizobium sp. 62]
MTMTLKQYLKPNTAVRPPVPSPEWWTPTGRSRGKRHFKFASKASSRGVAIIDDTAVESEARAERKGTLVLRARPDTLRVVEQSPQVEYVDANGVVHPHTFDLTVFRTDGKKIAVDFKPAAMVKRSGIRELHAVLVRQISPRTADQLLVLTERMYTRADLYNAELMHAIAREDFPKDDEIVLKLIRRMKGPASIADLVSRSKLGGYGFNATVRAIAAGHLRMTQRRLIDYSAVVIPAGTEG